MQVLADWEGQGVLKIFHVSFLCTYLPGGPSGGPPVSIVVGENQEYDIKRIVSYKKIRFRTVY